MNFTFCWEKMMIELRSLGTLYKHINSRLTHNVGIAPLIGNDGSFVKSDVGKAETLNSHFVKVGKPDDGTRPTLNPVCPVDVVINNVEFDIVHIFSKISSLKINSSSVPDGIPAVLLKGLNSQICCPLAIMFDFFF